MPRLLLSAGERVRIDRVRARFERLKMTQTAFAERIGRSRPNVSSILNYNCWSPGTLADMEAFLDRVEGGEVLV